MMKRTTTPASSSTDARSSITCRMRSANKSDLDEIDAGWGDHSCHLLPCDFVTPPRS